ncbi:MAG: hypothetical protein IJO69_05180 [Ruminiclostridium sp.]|nr:hypothetical protein [Ruminiclostridium sp.]MBQ9933209.1 hypothetical protein [Ruminiclostridium sp.]
MFANHEKKVIEMTKTESKKAGNPKNEEYQELLDFMKAWPSYRIQIKAPAKRKNEFKGLTYKYMKSYIEKHDDESKTAMTEFNTLTAQAKKDGEENAENLEAASYLKVKKWFLAKFPEIEQYREAHQKKVNEILAA